MNLLRTLAYGSVVSTFIMIILGGYVSASDAGNACPDWPLCYGQIVPPLQGKILIEYAHRLFALVVGVIVLATAALAWTTYRSERPVLLLSTAGFLVLAGQVVLGMVTVQSRLDPAVATAHLGTAAAVFAIVLTNALTIRNLSMQRRASIS